MPIASRTGAAAGAVKNRTRARAASGSFAALPTPAANPILVYAVIAYTATGNSLAPPEARLSSEPAAH